MTAEGVGDKVRWRDVWEWDGGVAALYAGEVFLKRQASVSTVLTEVGAGQSGAGQSAGSSEEVGKSRSEPSQATPHAALESREIPTSHYLLCISTIFLCTNPLQSPSN